MCWSPSSANGSESRAASTKSYQILSLTLFQKTPILQALQEMGCDNDLGDNCNQLNLFDL